MTEQDNKQNPGDSCSPHSELGPSRSELDSFPDSGAGKQKILIVDDRKENIVALRQILKDLDVEIVEATSGNEALAATLNHRFAVALLDVMMPGMGGYELAGHLRGDEKTKVIPIVFITASYADEQHMFKGYEAGGIDYIVKPAIPEVLLGKVRGFLELDDHRAQLRRYSEKLEELVAQRTYQLAKSERYFRTLIHTLHEDILVINRDYVITDMNNTFLQTVGKSRGEVIEKHCYEVLHGFAEPCDRLGEKCVIQTVFETGEHYNLLKTHTLKDGTRAYIDTLVSPVKDDDGNVFQVVAALRDVTDLMETHEALKESEARFSTIFKASPVGKAITRLSDSKYVDVNTAWEIDTGYTREEAIGHTPMELNLWVNPEDRDQMIRNLQEKGTIHDFESQIRHKSGKLVDMLFSAELINLAGEQYLLTVAQNITERKKLETQLLQAQKMESVGRLAGGVAHDFNNMLSVILGHTEMLMESIDPGQPIYEDLVEIQNAGRRSADLTRQLLSFARKQIIDPRVIDLDDAIKEMLKMLKRLIGEDIDIAWMPAHDLWPVKIDPGQIDQLLANLSVNARDAITGVGKVTIETANAVFDEAYCASHPGFVPGEFVMLAVSDDGSGIEKDILDNIFEPFFTTKDVGRGTGLGLSTVYGIVKQNNGFINVYSEPGKGSTFRIYIPRFEGISTDAHADIPLLPERSAGETVLVVEDELPVLKLTQRILERLGYKVLPANSPAEAIRLAKEHAGKIDLLITDVVMPEMNGRDLANQLLSTNPELKQLFMSGYTANAVAHRGVLEEGVYFLQKPFSTIDLAAKVRKALNGL
jgi:PAS domain S-box-containing protein